MLHHIQILRPINSGRWGTVYKAYDHKEKAFRAVKVLPKKRHDISDNSNARMIDNEITNMMRLRGHPNIVNLHDVMRDSDNIYIVQELCGGNTLQESIMPNKMTKWVAIKALKEVTNAVAACHDEGILFVDVKPSNVVYSMEDASFKLTDFGASVDTRAPVQQRITTATPLYSSPELMQERHATFPHDVWSIGIIGYQLTYGNLPTRDDIPILTGLDNPARSFIGMALRIDPKERATARELLEHPFLQEGAHKFVENGVELCE